MIKNKLIFKDAVKVRDQAIKSGQENISALYERWADEIEQESKRLSKIPYAQTAEQERNIKNLKKQLQAASKQVASDVETQMKYAMNEVSVGVTDCNVAWLESLGFDASKLHASMSSVNINVVNSIATGNVYKGGWNLSGAIWGDADDTLKNVYRVVAGGLAKNESVYDIAQQIEQYVRPSAAKRWNLVRADGVAIYPKQVDYSAQRLVRTLAQHTYQQSLEGVAKNNPFISGFVWVANGSNVCELCASMNGNFYKKGDLPMDHPNGMCTFVPAVESGYENRLADWFNGAQDSEIDSFARSLGYDY